MQLADVFSLVLGPDAPVEFTAYDGSKAGRAGSPVRLELRTPEAVRHILASPGQLGVARAYVTGGLEVVGDMHAALDILLDVNLSHLTVADKARIAKEFAPHLGRRPPLPPEEARPPGIRRHSRRRDAEVISHHYDVSNLFYSWVLGPSMAYTCAVYPTADATLEQAQTEKFDLVCRKLELKPGMRLLDVGCGWGGMVRHAVTHYGVHAIGVTLSREQAAWGQRVMAEEGLSDRATIRHQDYREVPEGGFDRISSIGLTEHIGKQNYPSYFSFLASKLVPEGRLLNHSITRPTDLGRTIYRRGFINRYVFPDGEMTGPGHLMTQMSNHGFEVRHSENLREHYAKTLTHWGANLEAHWDEAVAEVGPGKARVWRLYMAASRLGFERNMIQLHQFLAVKPGATGSAAMPLRPTWGS